MSIFYHYENWASGGCLSRPLVAMSVNEQNASYQNILMILFSFSE